MQTWTPPPPPPPGVDRPRDEPAGASRAAPAAVGALLLLAAAGLHVAALFPTQGGSLGPLSDATQEVVMEAVVAGGWLLAAVLVAVRRRAGVAGAALAVGLAVAEIGFVISAVGQVLAVASLGAGMWLLAASWLAGAAGAVAAVVAVAGPGVGAPAARRAHRVLAPLTAVAAVVLGVALLPAWDRYAFEIRALGTIRVVTEGSAFATGTPGSVMAGDIVAAAAIALVPIVGALWRPARIGVLCSAGVLVVVAGQLASALAGYEGSAGQFFPAAAVRAYGISMANSALTGWFDVEAVAAVALLVLVVAAWWTPAARRDRAVPASVFPESPGSFSYRPPAPWPGSAP